MKLHPLAEQFASVADAYERGRPDYPPAVIGAIAAELGIPEGGRVLDLAAGTGKLSRALLSAGFDVVAVEPLESLRQLLTQKLGSERVREGFAESIPLPDGSVDAVTVADAFHWFDHVRALSEIQRVLRPGGGLAVVATVPDWTGATWAHELGTIVMKLRPEHPHFDGPPWQDAVRAAAGWGEPHEVRLTVSAPAHPDRIVDHMASMSWIAGMPPADRDRTLTRIAELIRSGDTPPEMPMHFVLGLARLLGVSSA